MDQVSQGSIDLPQPTGYPSVPSLRLVDIKKSFSLDPPMSLRRVASA
ncbi:hypothetical protein NVV99_22515 [Rhodococcus sp. PAE-6]|nr:hypothetical protein [Rhodococcus sp. PAE-6]MCT7293687.1 hypothetical protein [Rhodococcus sp. PAE-6]